MNIKKIKNVILARLVVMTVFALSSFQLYGINTKDVNSLDVIEQQDGQFKIFDKVYKTPKGVSTWEAQLNFMLENDSCVKSKGLEMVKYRYVKTIETKEQLQLIKSYMVNGKIFYPSNSADFNKYSIKALEKSQKNFYAEVLNGIPESEIDNNLGIVEIEWKCNGEKYISSCFVSDKKEIVFDFFLFNITKDSQGNVNQKK